MYFQRLRLGFDREFEFTEEVEVSHDTSTPTPYAIGASIIHRIDELTDADGGRRTSHGLVNFISCRYAKTDQILDGCRETIYELSKKSMSNARILIFAGLGDVRSEAFSAPWITNKVDNFIQDIQDFNKTFGRSHEFAFAQMVYPTGMTRAKYDEIDKINRVYDSVNASLGKDTFATGRKLYRDCAVDLKPNTYVNGEPKFSPVEFWRNRNDIHPSDDQLRAIDVDLRKFVADGLLIPSDMKTFTGVTFKKKKRNFASTTDDSNLGMDKETPEKTSSIPGANWATPKRHKPWSNKRREAEFEKKIEGLGEDEKEKKRQERKRHQQEIEEDKKKKGMEAKHKAEKDIQARKQVLQQQLEQAKRAGDLDRETALTASIMRLGTDV